MNELEKIGRLRNIAVHARFGVAPMYSMPGMRASAFPSSRRLVGEVVSYRGVMVGPARRVGVDVDGCRSEPVHIVKKGMVSLNGKGVSGTDV